MNIDLLPRKAPQFVDARPIWPRGREEEVNLFVGFRALLDVSENTHLVLRVTASSAYRAFINGEFCGHGPARGPHQYFRVDEWDLTESVVLGPNIVALEVAGYNVKSYYLLDQPAFLQAEVLADGEVLASTAGAGDAFESFILDERVQDSQRYSIQRTFTEVYRLGSDHGRWRKDAEAAVSKVEHAVFPPIRLLARGVPYPRFHVRPPAWHTAKGSVGSDYLGGYPEQAMKIGQDLISEVTLASGEKYRIGTDPDDKTDRPFEWSDTLALSGNSYHLLDLGTNLTGFLGARVTCRKPTRLFLAFDEVLTEGDVDFGRINCQNIVVYDMPEGTFETESFEPYTLRYLKLVVLDGECDVENVYLREYANPDVWEASFSSSDERLNRIFAAGRETFRQNALDVFMDCPSRERAGWLCDSFFAARAAPVVSGNTDVERNFFENYLLPERLEGLPDGMLPMCYPADVLEPEGNFLPNWALWFVLQLEEYLTRSGDEWTVKALEPKVRRLFDYFRPFQNENGLLEKLEGWVFIEWSKANDFVQDVSYPTNMVYAAAFAAAARMYDDPELAP